jgi:hypothetical protein
VPLESETGSTSVSLGRGPLAPVLGEETRLLEEGAPPSLVVAGEALGLADFIWLTIFEIRSSPCFECTSSERETSRTADSSKIGGGCFADP